VPSRKRCPKKGEVTVNSDGVRRKFNGRAWRRLCSFGLCEVEAHCSEGFCHRHKALIDRRDEIMQQVGEMGDSGIPTLHQSMTEAPDDTILFDISELSQSALAKKGQIIPMRCGRFKKFNGKVWRWLCSYDRCWKEAQRKGLCNGHLKEPKRLKEV